MSGRRSSPAGPARGRLALITPDASPQEAAAIVAAVEQFARDSAPRAPQPAPAAAIDPWLQAALEEGVGRDPVPPLAHPWINP